MTEALARSILKLVGITTALIGAILTTQALIGWIAVPEPPAVSALGSYVSMEGMFGSAARTAFTQSGIVIVFGCLLCALSPALARFVAGLPQDRS